MGFWSRLFNRTPEKQGVRIELVTDTGNGFFTWHGDLYRSDIVRGAIRPTSRAIGKLTAKHIREGPDGLQVNPEPYMRFLLEEPNPLMTGQMLQEKLITQLKLNNNAFALIVRDDFGYPTQIYPIPSTTAEAIYKKSGELYLRFTLRNGKIFEFPYRNIIHLRQDFHSNDVFGDSPAEAITSLMEIVNTTDQGIVKAIQNSNVIKWLLKFKQVLRPEDIRKNVKEFVQEFLSIDSETGGAAASDAKYDVEQVKPNSYVPNAAQMDRTLSRVYSFFNTNEKIIQSKFTEDEWVSFYESEIEPLAIQMSMEFTRKLFSRKERSHGNKIIFEASNLQYASMKTKLGLVQMVDRGAMTPNEWRKILNMGPIEGGDNPIRRLDTAEVREGGEND
ncbi:HK97 family phage portal protein [Melghiribacillus thermohalophilus]|uniref:HK97 family phage portal protein n=1 Tax=Melghiribacillus thermohalophilus TaxID=1324956 RepID=A0A4R3N3Q4_9BACI|nr:phage portal protein [Melghiribacillus thermohalophilus]TCT23384.1 HK97 family phage portal protein [Melghiribacillus thermohalophilus]